MTNTTTSCSTNTTGTATVSQIQFRSKFAKVITDDNRSFILKAFQRFLKRPSDTAIPFLWKLNCCNRPEDFEVALQKLGLDTIDFPMESQSLLCSELRYQYNLVHDGFLDVTVPESCQESLQALKDKVASDALTIYMVTQKIRELLLVASPAYLRQTLALLEAEAENRYFGAIRSLAFSYSAAVYLKPFHTEIARLYRALLEHHESTTVDFRNLPFAGLGALVEDAGIVLATRKEPSEQTPVTQPKEVSRLPSVEVNPASFDVPTQDSASEKPSGFVPLTAKVILAHQDLFQQFLDGTDKNVWYQLGMLGLDLNTVFAKRESIETFLSATQAL